MRFDDVGGTVVNIPMNDDAVTMVATPNIALAVAVVKTQVVSVATIAPDTMRSNKTAYL